MPVCIRRPNPAPIRSQDGAPYRPPPEVTNIFDQGYDDEEEEEEEGAICRRLSWLPVPSFFCLSIYLPVCVCLFECLATCL